MPMTPFQQELDELLAKWPQLFDSKELDEQLFANIHLDSGITGTHLEGSHFKLTTNFSRKTAEYMLKNKEVTTQLDEQLANKILESKEFKNYFESAMQANTRPFGVLCAIYPPAKMQELWTQIIQNDFDVYNQSTGDAKEIIYSLSNILNKRSINDRKLLRPLFFKCVFNSYDPPKLLQGLLENGMEPYVEGDDEYFAQQILKMAVLSRPPQVATVKAMLQAGVNPNFETEHFRGSGNMAMYIIARRMGGKEIIAAFEEALLNSPGIKPATLEFIFRVSCKNNDLPMLKALFENKLYSEQILTLAKEPKIDGKTAMQFAVETNNADMIALLEARGIVREPKIEDKEIKDEKAQAEMDKAKEPVLHAFDREKEKTSLKSADADKKHEVPRPATGAEPDDKEKPTKD